jgi:hypothetical protein
MKIGLYLKALNYLIRIKMYYNALIEISFSYISLVDKLD